MTTCINKDKIDPSDFSVVKTKYWHICDVAKPNTTSQNIIPLYSGKL